MSSSQKMRANKQVNEKTPSWPIRVSTPVGVSARKRDAIAAKLKNKGYRTAYVEANIKHGLAHQIRINREARGWSQKKLASKCGGGMQQTTVSRLEDPSYGKYTLRTLLKLAEAFDVGLLVKFVPYSKLLLETENKSPSGLFARPFSDENLYLRQAAVTLTMEESGYFNLDIPSPPERIISTSAYPESPGQFFVIRLFDAVSNTLSEGTQEQENV